MKMKFRVQYLIVLTTILFLSILSCEKGGISENQAQIEYSRADQLRNLFNNGIKPLHEEFIIETEGLSENARAFKQNPSLENFRSLQNDWKTTANIWKRCETYDIGDINDSFIHTRINTWPTNSENIETNIEGGEPINLAFINSIGSSSKGIAAMEYLLFKSDANTTILELQSNPRRTDYIVALSKDFKNLAVEINSLWTNYGPSFTVAIQSNLEGGQNQTINAMVTLIEEIIISKLGRPLGDANGGTIDAQEFEAYHSDLSLEMIKNNIEELKKVFTGSYSQNTRRIGFDDYLTNLSNIILSDKIKNSFEKIEDHMASFNQGLNASLQSDPEKVRTLQTLSNELLILIKVDMASFIGSTITFNDNDGD